MKKLLALLVCLGLGAALSRAPQALAQTQPGSGIHQLVSVWNVGALTSGASVLGQNVAPSHACSVLRITVVLGSSAPLSILETDGTHSFTSPLNGGTSLSAGCYYTFVMELRNVGAPGGSGSGPTAINFVVGAPTSVPILRGTEVFGGVD